MSKHLIDAVAKDLGISAAKAAEITKAVFKAVEDVTSERGSLTIINFGSFSVKRFKRTSVLHKKEYKVDKNIIKFRTGAGFSKAINK